MLRTSVSSEDKGSVCCIATLYTKALRRIILRAFMRMRKLYSEDQ